jgi:hypothetical protein
MPTPKRSTKPDFTHRLSRIIEPKGGPGTGLATLADAAKFIGLMKPWRQARPIWEFAAELLLTAATTGLAGPHVTKRE